MDKASQEFVCRVASVVAHELRNPMAAVNNSAYFVRAKMGTGLDPKVEKHLKIIESEIARADRLLGDMLFYSRPCEPMAETAALDALVGPAVKAYAAPAGGKISIKFAAKGARVKVDEKMLAASLQHLLDNAFDAMGGKGSVTVATGVGKDVVFVSVADKGPGVNAKVRDSLFEPFVTTKPRGLGLGLSLTVKLLEVNGGSVTHSCGPKGSIFRIVLPKL